MCLASCLWRILKIFIYSEQWHQRSRYWAWGSLVYRVCKPVANNNESKQLSEEIKVMTVQRDRMMDLQRKVTLIEELLTLYPRTHCLCSWPSPLCPNKKYQPGVNIYCCVSRDNVCAVSKYLYLLMYFNEEVLYLHPLNFWCTFTEFILLFPVSVS